MPSRENVIEGTFLDEHFHEVETVVRRFSFTGVRHEENRYLVFLFYYSRMYFKFTMSDVL
jgi:hypothetical protein